MKPDALRNIRMLAMGAALLLAGGHVAADEVQCKDYWHTRSQWEEMRARCEEGARNGDPLSQVALAIYLLDGPDPAGRSRAQALLSSAAAAGYDDAYYWLGTSQADKKKAVDYLEKATGRGAMGLLALATAADMRFKGDCVPKDFDQARAVFRRAQEAQASNIDHRIPEPPGEWWSNAKWWAAVSALALGAERYGYEIKTVNGKAVVAATTPHPELSDKELAQRIQDRMNGASGRDNA